MKKTLLVMGLVLIMIFAFVGCSNADKSQEGASTQSETSSEAASNASWTLSVNNTQVTAADAAGFEVVTQTLKKTNKEGGAEDQECTGFTLKTLLDAAGVTDFSKVTVAASDGYEYELTADAALLPTTMLFLEQDGETFELPRLAVDGEGSKAWVKDVVSVNAQ